MLERMEGRLGEHHAGELRQESAEAERIFQAELKRWGWEEKDLPVRRKSDPEKLAMAARFCWPPDSCCGKCDRRGRMSSRSMTSLTRFWRWLAGSFKYNSGNSMFSNTVSSSIRLKL